jgi:septal ring factor EnvC (AmiA/AmiB activator)
MNAFNLPSSKASVVSILLSASLVICASSVLAGNLNNREKNDKESAKNSNVSEAQKLNGTAGDKSSSKDKNEAVHVQATPDKKKSASETASVVNQVPGVNVKKEDLEPPTEPPIKGFHPIKKLLRPVENLEGMSIKLEQQIMKLEGPIAALQPPMQSLQKQMITVDGQIGTMHGQLDSMQSQVQGVRSDLAGMKQEIKELKAPIVSLEKPIAGVATPLEDLNNKLNYIFGAILIAALAIALGTPLAAIVVYRNRHKLFPGMSDHELPKVVDGKEPVAASSNKSS